MKHEPVPPEHRESFAVGDDEVLSALLMGVPADLSAVDGDDARDDAQALDDLAVGRCHDHAVVSRWLLTAGQPGWKPFEEWLAEQDG